MERSSFFNAELNGQAYDRVYLAEDFARYFASFIGNGVFPTPSTNLQVISRDNNMIIRLSPGKAWINGYFYENTESLLITVDPADGVLNRIDRVVIRLDLINREIKSYLKKGTFASNPVPPTLTRNNDIWEIGLSDILINKGAIKITQADITDLRQNNSYCGLVSGTVSQIDTTNLFAQFESAFKKWFEDLKNKFGDDAVAHLQAQIQTWLDFKDKGGQINGTINAQGLQVNGKDVYHPGNKPTPNDIGALGALDKAESAKVADEVAWDNVKNKPSTFPPSSHNHNYAGSNTSGGPANSAVVLQTPRSINGAAFDGSKDITTPQWGASRNITIGKTTKSVNGSGNVTWSASEVGLTDYLPLAGGTMTGPIYIGNGIPSSGANNTAYSRIVRPASDSGSGFKVQFGQGDASFQIVDNGWSKSIFEVRNTGWTGIEGREIVTRGTNGSKHWVRYYDGTQICWGEDRYATGNLDMNAGTANNVFGGINHTITYPVTFTTTPAVSLSIATNGYQDCQASSVSTTQFIARAWSNYQTTVNHLYFHWIAIGRWR